MIRRILFVAPMLVMFWAGPASADHTYSHVLGTDQNRGGAGTAIPGGSQGATSPQTPRSTGRGDNLARTGSNNVTPLIQGGVVLIGGGTMLVLVARRRQVARRATA